MVNWLNSMFHKILLLIDAAVYWFVSMCYQLFVRMATLQLFDDAFFGEFANRIYAILGVFMLFYLAYALLNALIDPEKLTGDKGVSKIASNLVISLVLLGLIPTIFDYAYRLQNYILSSNILGAIILDSSTTDVNSGQEAMVKFGDSFSFTVMNTFINPDNYNVKMSNGYNWFDYKKDVLENSDYMNLPALSEAIVDEQVDLSSGEDVQVTYYVLISTAAGVFMCYMILSFTIDLGVRVFKFAFCQLLAPIPIIMRAMPGKKSVFDKWLKLTLTVFFEVFIRVAIMYLAVYFIRAIYINWRWENFSGIQGKLALAIIIMGIFAFAKQAPKMLSDILGMDSGNLKLGIGDKLRAGGFLGQGIYNAGQKVLGTTTGALGGLATGIFNKDINTKGAIVQGMAAGLKRGGNQFKAQREATFQSYYGYNTQQGIFGGRSFTQRLNDTYGKSVEKHAQDDANTFINRFESSDNSTSRWYITMHNELANGSQLNAISDSIMNADKFRKVFEDARKKADDEAVRRGIGRSDPEYKNIYKQYLDNLISRSTDSNLVRGLKTQQAAETMAQQWNDFAQNIVSKYGNSVLPYLQYSDSDLRYAMSVGHINQEEYQVISNFKQHWEQETSTFAKLLADGTYSRELTGNFDKIYNSRYKAAREQIGEYGDESSIRGSGTGTGVKRSKSDMEKLIDEIKKIQK